MQKIVSLRALFPCQCRRQKILWQAESFIFKWLYTVSPLAVKCTIKESPRRSQKLMMEMDFVAMLFGLYGFIFLTLAQEDSHVRYLYSLSRRDCHRSFSVNIFWACAELIIFFPQRNWNFLWENSFVQLYFCAAF